MARIGRAQPVPAIILHGFVEPPLPPVVGLGGLHHIWCGIGDPGVSVVPQTLQTIEQGISA